MIAFPEMLIGPATQAGMKTPDDPENFDPEEYPHFQVFLNIQLGAPLPSPNSHWVNAEVIAAIPDLEIRKISLDELVELGFEIGFPIP